VKKTAMTEWAKPQATNCDARRRKMSAIEKAKPRRVMPGLRGARRCFAIDEERVAAGVRKY